MTIDIMPTLIELSQTTLPENAAPLDGRSLKQLLLSGKQEPRPEPLFWAYRNQQAVRKGPWKLVLQAEGPLEEIELFRLKNGLGESKNLASKFPNKVQAMKRQLMDWHTEVTANPTKQPAKP